MEEESLMRAKESLCLVNVGVMDLFPTKSFPLGPQRFCKNNPPSSLLLSAYDPYSPRADLRFLTLS